MSRYPDLSNDRGGQSTATERRPAAGTARSGWLRPYRADAAAILLIVVVGLALRLAFAARMPVLIDGDSSHYHEAAHALLTGQGFPLPLARQPLYPAFIALVGFLLGESLERLALVQHLLGLGEPKGLVGLGTFGLGASNYAAKSPILRLADFSGKKLRVNATAMEREKMRRLGATAVPMPLNEVMPSLQRGVIDGTMSGTSVFVAFKFIDVVKTITVTNDTMLVSLAMVSKVWLDKLPPDLRKVVIDAGRETQVRTHKWEQEFSKTLEVKWQEIPWQTDLWAARRMAAEQGKPIFLWAMNGNPLGCT